MKVVWYSVNGRAFPLSVSERCERESIAERCAHDYYTNREGYRRKWPIALDVLTGPRGSVVQSWRIDLAAAPVFNAEPFPAA